MKNTILTAFTLSVMGVFLTTDPVIAGDRFKVYELAESGATIEFKMSPEEIAAEDAENARLAAIREANSNRPKERLNEIEMGDGGSISFPMSVEEIAAENSNNAKLAAIKEARSNKREEQVLKYELPDGGPLIEFYCKNNC